MSTSLSPLLAPMLSSPAMRAVCDDVACLQHMLDFEAALARAEAAVGIIPASAAGPITKACRAEAFDLAALAEAATRSGNLAIPLVKALTAAVAREDAEAARYVHWGATSQDVIDTAAMLTLRAAIDALLADLDRAIAGFATGVPASRHAGGGAHLAAARAADAVRPETRGICRRLAPLARAVAATAPRRAGAAVRRRRGHAGGARRQGLAVAEKARAGAGSALAEAPWHTHRDRIAEAASVFAILAGTCGKIARDVQLMMQTDVAEAFEPAGEGRGGSSTMPHKRNPVAAATALAAATMAPNSGGDDFCRASRRSRAQRRAMARGMADLADAAARHLRRARRYR